MPSSIKTSFFLALQRKVLKNSLLGFVKATWHVVEAGEFQENWHHRIICDALERVSRGECRKLGICVPPGSTKTLLSGVFWPAWDWLHHPERRIIHTTYGGSLAIKAARQMRDLVHSDLYKSLGGPCIPQQNTHAAKWFENDRKGSRFSGSVGGEVTGRHAHILVGDDLNKAIDALGSSLVTFDRAWDFWRDILPTRQADPKLTARVLIGQRLHRDDTPGRWREDDPDVEWIIIPMWAVHDELTHPQDTREEGELMWPGRFDTEELAELQRMGPTAVAAQLQQRPVPPGGQLLKAEYMSHRYGRLPVRLSSWLAGDRHALPGAVCRIYGDCTFKGKATSDYVVYQAWAVYLGEYYLLDQVRGQWGFREACQHLSDFAVAHPRATSVRLEDAANAPAMVDAMRVSIPSISLQAMGGGCLARQQQVEGPCWEAGLVHLPERAAWMGGADGFVVEHLSYDGLGTRHDDQVATSGLALLDLSGGSTASYQQVWGKVLGQGATA